ncbi:hypothetical protein BC829DRAFT_444413 [Chytridium lagenaria]|nr:hypothetical protein BC829DRAFT_444413 [Chytridium lagenaria]
MFCGAQEESIDPGSPGLTRGDDFERGFDGNKYDIEMTKTDRTRFSNYFTWDDVSLVRASYSVLLGNHLLGGALARTFDDDDDNKYENEMTKTDDSRFHLLALQKGGLRPGQCEDGDEFERGFDGNKYDNEMTELDHTRFHETIILWDVIAKTSKLFSKYFGPNDARRLQIPRGFDANGYDYEMMKQGGQFEDGDVFELGFDGNKYDNEMTELDHTRFHETIILWDVIAKTSKLFSKYFGPNDARTTSDPTRVRRERVRLRDDETGRYEIPSWPRQFEDATYLN